MTGSGSRWIGHWNWAQHCLTCAHAQVKDVKEFMSGDQVALLHCIKELRDPAKLGVVLQFVQLIQAGDSKTSMAGINQFVSFLSDKEDSRK